LHRRQDCILAAHDATALSRRGYGDTTSNFENPKCNYTHESLLLASWNTLIERVNTSNHRSA